MKLKSDIATISEVQFKSDLERGIAEGESLSLAENSCQKALETARILKQLGDSIQKIAQATGLTVQKVEVLN